MPITTTEGTGMVHTAVSAGTEDFKLGKELGLPMIPVINDDASYIQGFDFLSGQNAKKNPRLILDYMEEKKFVFKIEKYTHRYPACWRCKTELVWKVTDEWYISMDQGKPTLRERMKKVTNKISWIPEFGLKREIDWLDNMHDWLISKKNRYWGLALPIWECTKCGNFDVLGSKEELKEKAVLGWDKFDGKSPHKPQIDEVKIKCSKCGKIIERIPDVLDVWLDSGTVSWNCLYYPDKKDLFEKYWVNGNPTQYCGKDNTRFQSAMWQAMLMAAGVKNTHQIVVNGFITADGGVKMSKTLGNVADPTGLVAEYGTDALRYFLLREVSSFEDSPFTMERFKDAYNSGLANGLGNLTSRILTLSEKYLEKCPEIGEETDFTEYFSFFEKFDIKQATDFVWDKIGELDKSIQETEPFKVVKIDEKKGKELISDMVIRLYKIVKMLELILPETSQTIQELIKANKKPEKPLFLRKD